MNLHICSLWYTGLTLDTQSVPQKLSTAELFMRTLCSLIKVASLYRLSVYHLRINIASFQLISVVINNGNAAHVFAGLSKLPHFFYQCYCEADELVRQCILQVITTVLFENLDKNKSVTLNHKTEIFLYKNFYIFQFEEVQNEDCLEI